MVSAKHQRGVERGKLIPLGHPDIVFQQAHVLASTLSHASENNTAQIQGHSQPPRASAPCLSGFPPCFVSGKERKKIHSCTCSPSSLLSSLSSCIFSFFSILHNSSFPAGYQIPMSAKTHGIRVLRDTKGVETHFASAWSLGDTVKLPGNATTVQPDTSDHGPGPYPVPFSGTPRTQVETRA